MKNLIGKTLIETKLLLEKEGVEYIVTRTVGGKDEDILNEDYVICVREKEPLELIVSSFNTNIANSV